jgi:uncharacterized protein YbcC (UPF0753/DUF2309 family)
MEADEISKERKEKLKKIHESLNMFKLQSDMERLFKKVYDIQRKNRGRLY